MISFLQRACTRANRRYKHGMVATDDYHAFCVVCGEVLYAEEKDDGGRTKIVINGGATFHYCRTAGQLRLFNE